MFDQRRHARIEEGHDIVVLMVPERPDAEEEITSTAHKALEISHNGLRFLSFDPIPVHSFIRIDVPLKRADPPRTLSLSGIVRWVHKVDEDARYSIGVEFFDLPHDEDLNAWFAYVQERFEVTP